MKFSKVSAYVLYILKTAVGRSAEPLAAGEVGIVRREAALAAAAAAVAVQKQEELCLEVAQLRTAVAEADTARRNAGDLHRFPSHQCLQNERPCLVKARMVYQFPHASRCSSKFYGLLQALKLC